MGADSHRNKVAVLRPIRKHTNGDGMVSIQHKGRTLFSGYIANGLYPFVIIAPPPKPVPRAQQGTSRAARRKLHRMAALQRKRK